MRSPVLNIYTQPQHAQACELLPRPAMPIRAVEGSQNRIVADTVHLPLHTWYFQVHLPLCTW